jgi:hypothetical protein
MAVAMSRIVADAMTADDDTMTRDGDAREPTP